MIGKRQSSTVASVPLNFIPGFTKPRLSMQPECKPAKIERKVSSVCYHGVRVRIPEEAGLVESMALRGGVIGLTLPTPSMHLDCTEGEGVAVAVNFVEHACESDRETGMRRKNDLIPSPEKIKSRKLGKASGYTTDPSEFPVATRKSQVSIRTLSSKVWLKDFLSSVLEGKKTDFGKANMCASLPDIIVDSDSDQAVDSGDEKQLLHRSVSCVLDSSEDIRPNSRAAKRKYSRELLKKSQQWLADERKIQERNEREMYEALQDVMRSKLPKTFLATAKMFNPVMSGIAKKNLKTKAEHNVEQKRAGSLVAFFDRFLNDDAGQAKLSGTSAASRPTRSSIVLSPKSKKSTGLTRTKDSKVLKDGSKEELTIIGPSFLSDEQGSRGDLQESSSCDSGSPTGSQGSAKDRVVQGSTAVRNASPIVVQPHTLDRLQTDTAIHGYDDIAVLKTQNSAKKCDAYQLNIKVTEGKTSVTYKWISSSSIKIRAQSLRSEAKKSAEDQPVDLCYGTSNPLTQWEIERLDVSRKTLPRAHSNLLQTKPPEADLVAPLRAPVIPKLLVVEPVYVHPAGAASSSKLQGGSREQTKAILDSFQIDLLNKAPTLSVRTNSSRDPFAQQMLGSGGRGSSKVVKAPRWKGTLLPSEVPDLKLPVKDYNSQRMSAKETAILFT